MRNLKIISGALALSLLVAPAAMANDEEARLAAAQELVDVTMSRDFTQRMASIGWPPIAAQIKSKNPSIKPETTAKLEASYKNVMTSYFSGLMTDMVPLYAKYFTEQELKDLLAFNSTPLGRKSQEILPKIMAEGMPKIMQGVQALMPKIQQEFSEILKSEGFNL